MSVGGSKQSGTSSSNVTIPQFLEPFVRQSTDIAGTALGGLSDLIAPRTATEYTGPPIPLQGVNGPNGPVFVDPSQNAFVDAGGSVIAPFQDGTVPGLVQGNNNPVRVVGGDVFGQGSSGTEELFSMPQGEVEFGAMNDNLVAGFQPAQVAAGRQRPKRTRLRRPKPKRICGRWRVGHCAVSGRHRSGAGSGQQQPGAGGWWRCVRAGL